MCQAAFSILVASVKWVCLGCFRDENLGVQTCPGHTYAAGAQSGSGLCLRPALLWACRLCWAVRPDVSGLSLRPDQVYRSLSLNRPEPFSSGGRAGPPLADTHGPRALTTWPVAGPRPAEVAALAIVWELGLLRPCPSEASTATEASVAMSRVTSGLGLALHRGSPTNSPTQLVGPGGLHRGADASHGWCGALA